MPAAQLPTLSQAPPRKPPLTAASLPQWNAALADLSRAGRHADALALLPPLLAASQGLLPDVFTLPPAAKCCGALRDAAAGRQVHALAAKLGLRDDPFVGNSLVSMYGRCGRVEDAHMVFDGMQSRNHVSWNALMAVVSDAGLPRRGLELLQEALLAGLMPDEATLVTVLPMCAALGWLGTGRAVHGLAVKSGWHGEPRVSNGLVDMYAKCGEVGEAGRAFGEAPDRNTVVSWNVMLRGYARSGEADAAFRLLREMQVEHGVPADEVTVLSALPACAGPSELARLKELHCFAIRRGLLHLAAGGVSDMRTMLLVPNALIAAYGRCGCLLHAGRVFAGIRSKTVSSWNALIAAHAQNGEAEAAVELFVDMMNSSSGLRPDAFSIGSLLGSLRELLHGRAAHGFVLRNGLERDPFIASSLLSAYMQCGKESCARLLFDAMEEKDEVSWNTMIAGYAQNGLPHKSLQLFREMQSRPDLISATAALAACSQLPSVRSGKEVHCFALKAGYCQDAFLSSSVLDMYAKCGLVHHARAFFDRLGTKHAVSWTVMITGYAVNGLGKEAVDLYEEMRREGVEPDEFTYLGLLMACSHGGMLEEGFRRFREMTGHHRRLAARLEHYGCLVGMLARAGRLGDAVALMEEMPEEPDAKMLSAVLSACHMHGDADLGRQVAEKLLALEPGKAEHYVLASNMYAGTGQWDAMRRVRKRLRDAGVSKDPGCSWIHVAGKVHSFVAAAPPEASEARRAWHHLEAKIRRVGYVPDTSVVLHDLEEADKLEALRWHSEKQAIAFGLLSTAAPATVRVFKNLRMCRDCHTAAKLISRVAGRDIVVRDKTRFHHFRHGLCSCADYW